MKLLAGFLGLSAGNIVYPSDFDFPSDGKYEKKNTFCVKHDGEFSGVNYAKSFPEVSNDMKLAEKWLSNKGAANYKSSMSVMFNKEFRPESALLLHGCEKGPDVMGLYHEDELVGARFDIQDACDFYLMTPAKGVLSYKQSHEFNFNAKDARKFMKQRPKLREIAGRDLEITKQNGHNEECHKVEKWVKNKNVELEVGMYPFMQNEVSLWDKNLTETLDKIAMMNGLFDIPMKVGKEMYEQALTIQAMYKGLWDFGMQAEAAVMGVEVPCFKLQNCLSDPMSDCLDLLKECSDQKMLEGLIKKFLARNPEYYGNLSFGDVGMLLAQIDAVTDNDKEFYERFVRRFVDLLEKNNPEWELTDMEKDGLKEMASMLLMEIDEWEKDSGKGDSDKDDEMSIVSVITDLVEDPVEFLENMAEMDVDELMGMLRRTLGPIMGDEMMMVVEGVMRSIDFEMVAGLLNRLTAVFNGDMSFDELLMGMMEHMDGDMSGIVGAVDEILKMVGLDESRMVLANGFLDVGQMILMDVDGFLEAVNNSPDDVAKGIVASFSDWFEMNKIDEEQALMLVSQSPLFSFDTAIFNSMLESEDPNSMYGAIAMVSDNIFDTLDYIEQSLMFTGALEGPLLPAEMWAQIKNDVNEVANGILWSFLNLPEELVAFGVIEVVVTAVNKVLEMFVGFTPHDLAFMIAGIRQEIEMMYSTIRPFILPRVADAIDVAMDGRDTLSGLLNVVIDQVNFVGQMTNFTINFDEIDAMFVDAPGIKSWLDAVRYGFLANFDDEYFNIGGDSTDFENDPTFPIVDSSDSEEI